MRLFQVKIAMPDSYSWTEGHATYDAQYADKRASYPARMAELQAKLSPFGIILDDGDKPLVITDQQLMHLAASKYPHEVVHEITHPAAEEFDLNAVMNKFNRMAAKLLSLPGLQRDDSKHDAYNQKCEVHMPGQALSVYNEVMLLENMCTDELQANLDQGWRIIAACPQPDARRPDYIMGRFDPTRNIEGARAKRSHA